jgi:adenosine 3'-phospho 5'-phosphosulfate transporter B3
MGLQMCEMIDSNTNPLTVEIDTEDVEMQKRCGDNCNLKSSEVKEDETIVTSLTGDSSVFSNSSDESGRSSQDFEGYDHNEDFFLKTPLTQRLKSSLDVNNNDNDPPALSEKELILFGLDFSNRSSTAQFMICAFGVFFFNILYGYLQELIQIQIAGRQFALFLGACQFAGYAFWSAILSQLRTWRMRRKNTIVSKDDDRYQLVETFDEQDQNRFKNISQQPKHTNPSFIGFFLLAVIRAIDLGLTNLSMRYLNYPAKTLIKSSRVIFTMIMGVFIGKKKYSSVDYSMVGMLVCGLSLFLHADLNSDAIFHPIGVCMLITSLSLDGSISNWSELLMNRHNLGQDEFQMKLYFFSFVIMTFAAYQTNELQSGIQFFFNTDGTMSEVQNLANENYSWSVNEKTFALVLFSTFGIFGGSCACAITKRFGALAMSITTTTRKAATIFISFAMFPNSCTIEHIMGVSMFVMGLLLKGGVCNYQSSIHSWIKNYKGLK